MANPVILLRVSPQLRAAVEQHAKANERTVSQEVRLLLKREYAPTPLQEKN